MWLFSRLSVRLLIMLEYNTQMAPCQGVPRSGGLQRGMKIAALFVTRCQPLLLSCNRFLAPLASIFTPTLNPIMYCRGYHMRSTDATASVFPSSLFFRG